MRTPEAISSDQRAPRERATATTARNPGRPRHGEHQPVDASAPPPGWQWVDLGLGEALYIDVAIPREGECHPHGLGLYDRGGLLPDALSAFEPSAPEHWRMVRAAAEMLRVDRHELECGRLPVFPHRAIDPLSRWAWCVACGGLFEDGRVVRGEPIHGYFDVEHHGDWDTLEAVIGGVRDWCPQCRHNRGRHTSATRMCAAPGCFLDFEPANARQVACSNACRKRLGDWLRRHDSRRSLRLLLEVDDPAAGFAIEPLLPCLRAAYGRDLCECLACLGAR